MSSIENRSDRYPSALNPGTTIYTIQKWDTLSKIARITGKDIAEIARINDIKDPSKIKVWQKIYLTQEAKMAADDAVGRIARAQSQAQEIRRREHEEYDHDEPDDNIESSWEYRDVVNAIFMRVDPHMNQGDRLWYYLYIIQNTAGLAVEEYESLSEKRQIAILEQHATQDSYMSYVGYATSQREQQEAQNRAHQAQEVRNRRYMTPAEQDAYYRENWLWPYASISRKDAWWNEERR